MALLPSLASSNIADHLSKPLPTITHQRIVSLIGAGPTKHPLASATPTTTSVAAPTAVASATPISDSVPTLHPNLALTPTLPIVLDTGASFSRTPFASDFLPVAQAPFGLIRSAASVAYRSGSKGFSKGFSKATLSNDPYTLITGEDTIVDLSSPDTIIDSDSGPSFAKAHFAIREFGTATLTFIYSKSSSELLHIFVDPNQIDWLHWVPLPRLTPTESYFHIFGCDYLQAIAFFHLIPIWIYFLLHFVVNLED